MTIDFGLKLGWCVGSTPLDVTHGMKKLGESSRQSHGYRWVNLYGFLDETFNNYDVRRVVYESVRRHDGVAAAHVWGGGLAVLQLICLQRSVFFEHLEVASIKKQFAGHGSSKKERMIAECANRGFMGISDDNEADAVAIWSVDYEKRTGKRSHRQKDVKTTIDIDDAWA